MNTLRKEPEISPLAASWTEVGEDGADQRIDNFLIRVLKGVPKSHLYRLLRTGQVRVNSRRVDATYRLQLGDRVRLPPVRTAAPDRRHPASAGPGSARLSLRTLLEDECFAGHRQASRCSSARRQRGEPGRDRAAARGASRSPVPGTGPSTRPRHVGCTAAGEEARALTDLHAQIRAGAGEEVLLGAGRAAVGATTDSMCACPCPSI